MDVESNAEIGKTLDKAENTLIKLEEFCRNKKERNLEKSMITDIMVCYWNAVGIKLQFGAENSSTTLLLTNHDEENRELKECKIEMNISNEHFEGEFGNSVESVCGEMSRVCRVHTLWMLPLVGRRLLEAGSSGLKRFINCVKCLLQIINAFVMVF